MIERLLSPDCRIEDRDGIPVPVSRRFGDVYFSARDGLAESRLVFLEGNRLAERMAGRRHFTIAETGFGTGLNLLTTLNLLDGLGGDAPRLTYIATEIAPLDAAGAREALGTASTSSSNERLPYLDELLAALPPRWPGRHRCLLAGGRVTLDLLYGDSAARLAECAFAADAWFLDGFAPARNPEMWDEGLLRLIAGRSAPGATLASFTAAGAVRRGLEQAGFAVERHPGHGAKRHRITGYLKDDSSRATGGEGGAPPPDEAPDELQDEHPTEPPGRVVVIGTGIAGASVAHALTRQGRAPLVLAAGPAPADGASGGIAAVQTPRLTATDSPEARLSLAAWGYARRLAEAAGATTARGSIVYAADAKESLRQSKILDQGWPEALVRAVDEGEAEAESGIAMGLGGTLYPEGGAIDPERFTRYLLEGCELQTGAQVREVRRAGEDGDGDGGGGGGGGIEILLHGGGTVTADAVVLAAGSGLPLVAQPWLAFGGLQVTAGQASHLRAGAIAVRAPNETVPGAAIPGVAMSFGGYMAPAADGRSALGAGFDAHDPADPVPPVTAGAHERNLARLPDAARAAMPPASDIKEGRAGLRLAAPDRQPLAGRLDEGVYILAALGARGMSTAPLLGELVASLILGLPSPLDSAMEAVVEPGRLERRRAKR